MTTHEAPLTHTAIVTHVMVEADSRGVFDALIRDVGHYWQPVKWIVVAEPIVCPACVGSRRQDGPIGDQFPTYSIDCPDCNGTGLPDVKIVSVSDPGPPWIDCLATRTHGVVAIGAAVPIFDGGPIVTTSRGWQTHIAPATCGGDWLLWTPGQFAGGPRLTITDITDQFGNQAVTPGMWAHPILT